MRRKDSAGGKYAELRARVDAGLLDAETTLDAYRDRYGSGGLLLPGGKTRAALLGSVCDRLNSVDQLVSPT